MEFNPFGASDDPFAVGAVKEMELPKEKIHVRIQDQKKRKLTLIEGLDDDLDQHRIAKAMKKAFSCSSTVHIDKEGRDVIMLQGDQRSNVKEWLLAQQILTEKEAKERLVLHGF
jgi:translation initiation factor 1